MTTMMHARCEQAHNEAGGVKVFTLRAQSAHTALELHPGGHVAIEFPDAHGVTQQRCYSIVRRPAPDTFEIAVKKTGNQGVADSLHARLNAGELLAIKYAASHITVDAVAGMRRVLMLAGGIGITLPIALIRELGKLAQQGHAVPRVELCLCTKSISAVPFLHELLELDLRSPWFSVRIFVTGDAIQSRTPHFHAGRPSDADLSTLADPDAVVICGSHAFASAQQAAMRRLHPGAKVLIESFSPPASDAAPIVVDPALAAPKVAVEGHAQVLKADPRQSLLDLLEQHKLPIKSQCRSGICGSCRIRVVDGDCRREADFALSPGEHAQGFALACCTYPSSNTTLTIAL
ncbi:2Fe-2S iron-sulfur cluster-binding protein [Jeongeupia chitinilytica]|uniref:Hybrid-cluster NAD(P)-dependent oxidoreductase n=1 Tax=Jeongeupia chitinilytica TaxID=1041641 RepID=A0ABQ3H5R5_9NEIS|nr:2Fe-2S iron-sulfur cluster-binding protein [Jeongeupia chitinilytica]GHD66040.1 hybrid-cluster NAD(P)-dependent oxidoreductase [Jeongeupia chitinilytica]